MTRPLTALALLGLAIAVGGCAAVDRRTTGTQMDDQRIESHAGGAIDKKFGWKVHVNVTSYNRHVLITGEVPDAVTHAAVEKLIAGTQGVRTLTNELAIGPQSSLAARTGDTVVTSNVKSRFLGARTFNAVHVKVVTEAGTVFLLGTVSEGEANAAVDLARTTDGVKKVVKVFEYCKPGEKICRPIP